MRTTYTLLTENIAGNACCTPMGADAVAANTIINDPVNAGSLSFNTPYTFNTTSL